MSINWEDEINEDTVIPMSMGRVSSMAQDALQLAEQAKSLEEQLQATNKQLDKLLNELIPGAMDEMGVSEFKLADGSKISVKNVVKGSISEERKAAAFSWLRENGFGGMIKTKLESSFGRGEEEEAQMAFDALLQLGIAAEKKEGVHFMTLNAFLKEQLEAGNSLPMETFGVMQITQAKITQPKGK